MTISTLNGVLSGFQTPQHIVRSYVAPPAGGRPIELWYSSGINNSVGVADTTLNGVTLSSSGGLINGQIPHFDPGQGISSYLGIFNMMVVGQQGYGMLADRLWHNGGITITSTSLQTIASPTWPARDNNGLTLGDGVQVGLSVSATTGAGTPTAVLSYTNSSGASGRSANLQDTTQASSTVGMFYRFALQAGDLGVQSIQGITFTGAWASGTVNLVAYRLLAVIQLSAS